MLKALVSGFFVAAAVLVAAPAQAGPTFYTVHSGFNGRCLDFDNANLGNKARVQLRSCNGKPQQLWYWSGTNLVNAYHSKCLDAPREFIWDRGAQLQMYDCLGWENAQWRREGSTLRNGYNGWCMDAALETIWVDGGKVQNWECNGGHNQNWEFRLHSSN
ncbi:RICIN domain-containing protein [Actinoplanes oblitus]|uniref:RICIN domain-containing protein n=1 Tax=Actinoplanes oblitus TaxID=3040509 RepID=A0ABY8WT80_9ACTN|nr:RICIN domain-containing protein [Actinoplanes oblitus]WIN00324.1 RICIN domain-containing protein [Actinoplanes oblitus]